MTRSPASRAFNRHALGAAVAALWSTHGLAQQAFPSGNPPPQFCRVGSFTELNVMGRYNVSEQLQLHADATNLLNRHAPPDLQTFGAAGGGGQLGGPRTTRLPPGRRGRTDVHARSDLHVLSRGACRQTARQNGRAGALRHRGRRLELERGV